MRRLAAACVLALVFTLHAGVVFAGPTICCKCAAPNDPKTTVCLNTANADCASLPTKSANAKVKTLGCSSELVEAQCKPVSGGGVCLQGPTDELLYTPAAVSPGAAQTTGAQPITPPTLNVPISGLSFATIVYPKGGYLEIPFFAQYIAALYRLLIGLSTVAAAIMIVYGGFRYITGATMGDVKRGKEIITDAVIGLVLVLGAFTILQTVNPNTLNLTAIKLQQVDSEDYQFMARSDAGFKNADDAQANELAAGNAPISPRAPAVPPQSGESVSIDGIKAEGTFTQQLAAYCTKPTEDSYDAKIQALVQVVLGFKKVCVDEKGCAYYRGGFTTLSTGKITGTLLDVPYAISNLKTFANVDPDWPVDCATGWSVLAAGFYKPPAEGSYNNLTEFKAVVEEKKKTYADYIGPGGRCYKFIFEQYQQEFARRYEDKGVFGGDCGTTIIQMYTCAGGKVAQPSGSPASPGNYLSGVVGGATTRPETRDVVVWKAKNYEDLVAQYNKSGGPKFGDIFSIGKQNWQHNFMYTGGRDDVPFEFFEMGSSGSDGTVGAKVSVGFPTGISVGGMGAWPRGTPFDFWLALAKKRGRDIFPVSVWRPYDYEPCSSKAECKDGQACFCTAGDKSKNWADNKCNNANICHTVITSFCRNDEQCPRGSSCKKATDTSASGTCTKD